MKQVLHFMAQQFVWDKMLIIMEYFVDSFTCEECKFWNTRTVLEPMGGNSNPPMSTAKLLVGTWQTSTSWTWSLTQKISGPVYVINKINICNYLVAEFDLWHARAPVSVTCTCTWLSRGGILRGTAIHVFWIHYSDCQFTSCYSIDLPCMPF